MTTTARKRRRRPHSGTSSRLTREARVQARAIPELQAALAAHQITLYRGGELAKLPDSEQEAALTQWTSRALMRRDGSRLAAKVIRRELKRRSKKVDLGRIAAAIVSAIAEG
jgi:hypothetical protein